VTAGVIQNGNAYEDGLGPNMQGLSPIGRIAPATNLRFALCSD
jgi:hypothetical protein